MAKGVVALRESPNNNIPTGKIEILVKESQHPNLLNNPVEITEGMLRELYTKLR